MAQGFLSFLGGTALPWETKLRGAYPSRDPGIDKIYNQLQNALNPQVARRRARRGFGRAAGMMSRGTEGALGRLNETLAQRGMTDSGFGLGLEGALRQNEAFGRSELYDEYRNALEGRQAQAGQDYMGFLNQILGMRTGASAQSADISRWKAERPSGLQRVLGDISNIQGVLSGGGGGGGGGGAIEQILGLLKMIGIF